LRGSFRCNGEMALGLFRRICQPQNGKRSDMHDCDADGLPIPWDEVRRDFEAGALTRNAVAKRYRMPFNRLVEYAAANKWVRPDTDAVDRRILIFKLLALLEHQIDLVSEQMDKDGKHEAGVLGNPLPAARAEGGDAG